MAPRRPARVLVLGMLAAGCGKTDRIETRPTTMISTGGSGSGGTASEGGAGPVGVPLMCGEGPHPGPSPLTRLKSGDLIRSVLAQVA